MTSTARRHRPLIAALALLTACLAPPAAAPGAAPDDLARGIARADSIVAASVGVRYPGAVLAVMRDGALVHERAFGHAQLFDAAGRTLASPPVMHASTLFDMASLTKVLATTNAIMRLAGEGKIDVDAPVYRYLPDFRGPHLDSITVRHLLTHSAGLVQWQPLYYHASTPAAAYAGIRDMPLQWGVGEGRHYSDFSFMLLGYIVERVTGERLDAFVEREVYRPMGLHETMFLPLRHGRHDIAATETGNVYERHMVYDSTFGYRYRGDPTAWDHWRHEVLVGEVDDGNAWYAHGGVAGHAGLFSTAAEAATLVDMLVSRGGSRGRRVLDSAVVDRFLTRDRYDNYLGWMRPAGLPSGSFMHTGFTGTYALGVPRYGLSVVLLTNRQQMGPDGAGYFPNVAPVQAAVARAIVEGAARR